MKNLINVMAKYHDATNEYQTIRLNEELRALLRRLYDNIDINNAEPFRRSSTGMYELVAKRYPKHALEGLSVYDGQYAPDIIFDSVMFDTIQDNKFSDTELVADVIAALKDLLNAQDKRLSFTINIQYPGQCTMLHYDSSIELASKEELETLEHLPNNFNRGVIFFEDWKDGQVCQLGKNFLMWKALDSITYWDQTRVLHGFANFGYDDRISLVVTWDK
jgi:hypothetical protein